MGRTVFIGDVHGCRDELAELLGRVGFSGEDRLVMVGDLVVRGPDPCGTIDLLRSVGARSVRGNHEDRLLRHRARRREKALGDLSQATAEVLREEDWAYLEALPLWLDVPVGDAVVRVVHAGLAIGVPIEEQVPRVLMYTRCIDEAGVPVERHEGTLWGERYVGPPHVVFGHNASEKPQLHAWATGLDTGCVYGRELTAMVLGEGGEVPQVGERGEVLVTVRARRAYV